MRTDGMNLCDVRPGRTAILTQIDNFRQGPGHPRLDPVFNRFESRVARFLNERLRHTTYELITIVQTRDT